MNWQITLWDERGVRVVEVMRYCEYTKREAEKRFREHLGLVGKHIAHRMEIRRIGAMI